ncbi:MAG: acyloxyacyl hydrolase [Sulfitobacter sp.]|mgnify:CR=1 FL=1|uniref:acyloxyacyl hydrolase n=1 Tax=Sulfitobacter sp. TaxID=1903071 RepID=UPI003296C2C8
MQPTVPAIVFMISTSAAYSGEFAIGVGADDVAGRNETTATTFVVEHHATPFHKGPLASYSFAVAAQIDEDEDLFVGGGLHARWSPGDGPWSIESSFMPGYYQEGPDGTALGGKVQFRTLVGLSYELDEIRRISLALDHKSNARLESTNPGSETIAVRYHYKF